MKIKIYSIILFVFFLCQVHGQKIVPTEFSSGFTIPVDIAFDHVDNMYVVGKRGIISIVQSDGTKLQDPFLDIDDRVNSSANERGLLGLAFHPDYENNGYFFVNYTGVGGTTFISRFTRNSATTADPDSEEILLSVEQPFNNHNAGPLHFGPDGYLYVPMGDGGSGGDPGNRSQNPLTLLGKMLRIDVDNGLPYQIPDSNPFANSTDTLPEIWSLGLRNPWKFSFDSETGDMYIADVGQNKWEEVSVERAGDQGGLNYGWRCYEGFEAFNTSGCGDQSEYVDPVFVYFNDENKEGCSITGGYVYRGSDPYLFGKYIYGDFCTGKIWALYQDPCGSWYNEELLQISSQELSTFGQDNYGEIYYAELGNGKIFKIEGGCKLSTTINVTNASCGNNGSIEVIPSENDAMVDISGGSFENLEPGQYDITVTNNAGCVNYTCVIVEDEGDFDFPDISNPELATVCEGESLLVDFSNILIGFPNVMVRLYQDSVVLIEDWDGILTIDKAATYQVEFYDSICSSDIIDFLLVEIVDVPDLEIVAQDTNLIASDGFVTYQWYEGTMPILGNLTNILEDFKFNTNYSVIGTTIDGCVVVSDPFILTNTIEQKWMRHMKISPNPTTGIVKVSLKETTIYPLIMNIYSSRGELIFSTEYSSINKEKEVDLSEFPSGVYSIQLTNGENSMSKLIYKQ